MFRPRFSLGFGLSIGYPVAYNSPYYYPDYFYPYAYPYPYSYDHTRTPARIRRGADLLPSPCRVRPDRRKRRTRSACSRVRPPGPRRVRPNGGPSFEITPFDARVIVDGHDVGSVGQFTPTSTALGLSVGRHHIEIVANGYRTMSSDVDVRAGQVIPFQGQMER